MLNSADIAVAVADLSPRVTGAQVQKVRAPDAWTVLLSARRPGETVHLVLSCAAGVERLAEADGPGPSQADAGALVDWLRASLRGRRLVRLRQLDGDRVVELRWGGGRLVAELTGRHANLFGLEGDRIVATARTPTETERGLATGAEWTPPPPLAPSPDPPRFESARAIEIAATERSRARAEAAEDVARRRLMQGARRRLERLWAKVAQDVERAEGADEWRRRGELLKPEVHRIRRGDAAIEVTDWYAEGTPRVVVELDPLRDGPQNVQRCFDRYRRARDGLQKAEARLRQVEAQLATLDALDAAHPDAASLEQAMRAAGLVRAPKAPRARKQEQRRLPYREFRSAAGERILVGRGPTDNHALTFRIARGNDHWFHARDSPGAHVVVPLPAKDREPHPETLRDAAALAAHHSDLRGEPVVDVTHVRRKQVRAMKGAPGRVTLSGAKTLTVTDAPARVERLYGGQTMVSPSGSSNRTR